MVAKCTFYRYRFDFFGYFYIRFAAKNRDKEAIKARKFIPFFVNYSPR